MFTNRRSSPVSSQIRSLMPGKDDSSPSIIALSVPSSPATTSWSLVRPRSGVGIRTFTDILGTPSFFLLSQALSLEPLNLCVQRRFPRVWLHRVSQVLRVQEVLRGVLPAYPVYRLRRHGVAHDDRDDDADEAAEHEW